MEKMLRKKTPGAAKLSRYHAVLSIGVRSLAHKDGAMAQFLPQRRGSGQTDAVLSKRSLLVDMGMSDIQLDDMISTADLLDKLREGTDAYRATQFL